MGTCLFRVLTKHFKIVMIFRRLFLQVVHQRLAEKLLVKLFIGPLSNPFRGQFNGCSLKNSVDKMIKVSFNVWLSSKATCVVS